MKLNLIISIVILLNISCYRVERLNNTTKVIAIKEGLPDSINIEHNPKEEDFSLDQKSKVLEEIKLPFWLTSKGFKSVKLIVDISSKDTVRVFQQKDSANFDYPNPNSELKIFKYKTYRSNDTRLIDTIDNFVVTVFEPNFDKDFSLLGFWKMKEDSIGLIALPRNPMPGHGVSSIDTLFSLDEEILIIGESSYGDEYILWGIIWVAKYTKQSNGFEYILSKEFGYGGNDTLTIGTMVKYEIDIINKELIINSFKYKSIYQEGIIEEDLISTERIKI